MMRLALTSLVLAGLCAPAVAQEARRQLDAHAHGEGRLAMAIEGPRVEMELKVPASDIVGFEHAPSNAKQRQAIADAKKRLAKLADLLVLPNEAGCKLTSAKVEVIGAAAGSGKAGHKHGHSHSHDHSPAKKADGKAQAGLRGFRLAGNQAGEFLGGFRCDGDHVERRDPRLVFPDLKPEIRLDFHPPANRPPDASEIPENSNRFRFLRNVLTSRFFSFSFRPPADFRRAPRMG